MVCIVNCTGLYGIIHSSIHFSALVILVQLCVGFSLMSVVCCCGMFPVTIPSVREFVISKVVANFWFIACVLKPRSTYILHFVSTHMLLFAIMVRGAKRLGFASSSLVNNYQIQSFP